MLAVASLHAWPRPLLALYLTSLSCGLCRDVAALAPCPGELPPPGSCRQPGRGCKETKALQGTAARAQALPHNNPRSWPMPRA